MLVSHPLSASLPVTLLRNGNHSDAKTAVIKRCDGLKGVLTAAKNKFKMRALRAFYCDGNDVEEKDFQTERIAPGVKLVVSDGADFIGFKVEKRESNDESIVLGGVSDESKERSKEVALIQNDLLSRENNSTSSLLQLSHGKIILIKKDSYVENDAISQLESTAALPNMVYAVGLPDLHPGKGFPIGVACASSEIFYPHLVGNDIGCGMSFYQTSIKARKLKLDQWVDKLQGLETAWDGDSSEWLRAHGVKETDYDATSLGTIGGGNHFAELQEIEEIVDQELFDKLGLDQSFLFLLVHSGSRGFGEAVLDQHIEKNGYRGLKVDSPEGQDYLYRHNWAMEWAKCNRSLIAHRFLECLTGKEVIAPSANDKVTSDGSTCLLDVWHNCVVAKDFLVDGEKTEKLWLHRKGAAPADVGPVVIPGSRGHFSYLVQPSSSEKVQQQSAYSLAHGAGRRWNRSRAFAAGEKIQKDSLIKTKLGSRVICEKKELLYEEIPDAYKEITDIIADLEHFGLIQVIAILRPIITYKTRVKVYQKTNHRE